MLFYVDDMVAQSFFFGYKLSPVNLLTAVNSMSLPIYTKVRNCKEIFSLPPIRMPGHRNFVKALLTNWAELVLSLQYNTINTIYKCQTDEINSFQTLGNLTC